MKQKLITNKIRVIDCSNAMWIFGFNVCHTCILVFTLNILPSYEIKKTRNFITMKSCFEAACWTISIPVNGFFMRFKSELKYCLLAELV